MTKSARNCKSGHIYLKKSLIENFILCAVKPLNPEINGKQMLNGYKIMRTSGLSTFIETLEQLAKSVQI